MKKIKKILVFFLLVTGYWLLVTIPAKSASEFNPNFILSDTELFDHNSMSLAQIQKFLEGRGGTLSHYIATDIDGAKRTAGEIIWRAAKKYKVSPKYILVTLQKEQSLVENPNPSQYNYDWAMGYALCDSCYIEDPRIIIFKGFANQVDRGTWRQRYYVDHPDEFRHQIGQTQNIDSYQITPANQATVNLYNYTPHYSGNYKFWQIWMNWFARDYPDGSLLQEEDKEGVWLIKNNKRRPIISRSALLSRFDPNKIIIVSRADLEKYEIGKPIKFPQYSLLRPPSGTVYLLVDDTLRGIASKEVLRKIGFHPEEIIDIETDELKNYTEGKPITLENIYPVGALLQDRTTGGVYYVEEGLKHPIWSKELLLSNFKNRQIIPTDPIDLGKYNLAESVKFKDGELIKSLSTSAVYVISDGKRLPIISGTIYEELGYKWENIVVTSDKVLSLHPLGDMIGEQKIEELPENITSTQEPKTIEPQKPSPIEPITNPYSVF